MQTSQTPQTPQTSAQSPAPAGSPSGSTTGAGHWEHGQVMLLGTDRGPAVLVHYPRRGLALRGADGTWSVRAYPVYRPTLRPAAPRSEPWARGLPVAVVAGWTAALAAIGARRLRTEPADRRPRLLAGVLGCQLLCLGWILIAGPLSGARVMWVLPGWLVAGVVSCWLLLPMTVLLCRTPEGRARLPRFEAPLVGTVVGALALVPYLLWAHGSITVWSRASHLVLCCAVAGAAVGAPCGSLPRRGRAGVPVERRPLGRATRR
ncbi:hypothetical protein BX265_8122 [Streptomyces sp. TLI_235]|nr:hypothetical protein BX265_8122 [Streptomyces sp. TLI_235]